MSDINEQLKRPRIWIEQVMALRLICNQIFCAVLGVLHMSDPKCKDTCETENALFMSDPECECLTCNQVSYTVLGALPVSDPKCQDDCKTCVKEKLMMVESESTSTNSLLLKGASTTDVPNFNWKAKLNFIDDEASQNIMNTMGSNFDRIFYPPLLQKHKQ